MPPEQKLLELAELGVLYLPANLFFSEGDREVKNRRNTVRVSLSNAGPEKIRQAAEITRDYLTS